MNTSCTRQLESKTCPIDELMCPTTEFRTAMILVRLSRMAKRSEVNNLVSSQQSFQDPLLHPTQSGTEIHR